jgi:hypothetical protein
MIKLNKSEENIARSFVHKMSGFGAMRLTPQAKTKVYSSSDVLSGKIGGASVHAFRLTEIDQQTRRSWFAGTRYC